MKVDNLEYLKSKLEGMTPEERLCVHYSLVGAAAAWIDEKLWRSIVDRQASATKERQAS